MRRAFALLRGLLTEQLQPGRAAAAVWLGVALGIIPIYGLQSIVALALATLLRLNRPLTFAATFVNNPLLQPFLVAGSLQLGYLTLRGVWLSPATLTAVPWREHLLPFFAGSLILSVAVGGSAALAAYLFVALRGKDPRERAWRVFVNERFRGAGWYARGFVRWKTRLDRIFATLLEEDLGSGPVVDLGCGYGASLALVAFRDPQRVLHGCDRDAGRVRAASAALRHLDAHLTIDDVRSFPLPDTGLILILDVLQYLAPPEQDALLLRCRQTLRPGGRLIFRVPDAAGRAAASGTRLLDRLLFGLGGFHTRPAHRAAEEYVSLLTAAGMRVSVETHRNRLPLSHTLFRAHTPGDGR